MKILLLVLMMNLPMSVLASENQFWEWFKSNKSRIEKYESGDEKIMEEIRDNLHSYNDKLYFEFSNKTSPKEFIVTAEGDREQFDSVFKLVNAAPNIENWKIIALKPPKAFQSIVIGDVVYDSSKIWFLPLKSNKNPKALGLRVGVPELKESDKANSITATIILMEAAIGELAAVNKVHYLDVIALPDEPESKGYIKMLELPSYIELHEKDM